VPNDFVPSCAEDEAIEVDAFGFSWCGWFGVLARAHGEEEGPDDYVGYDGIDGVEEGRVVGRFEDLSEEFGCNGFLALRRWVYIFVGLEEGSEGGELVLAARDVKGAWLEMVPKRLSQTACGSFDSA